jgi:two-component system nitrate/nitrite response regulator NarL
MTAIACSPIVIIHPSRLFSEALGGVLNIPPFKLEYVATDLACIPFEMLSETALFIVGGRTPDHLGDLVRNIKQRLHSSRVVAIGGTNEPEGVLMALEAGAIAYLHEEMTTHTMIMALELVLQEELVLPHVVVKFLQRHVAGTSEAAVEKVPVFSRGGLPFEPHEKIEFEQNGLSSRQTAILQALIDGAPNKVIAQKLNISEATVKLHVKTVLRKIHAKNRTQAAVWAVKHPRE